MAAAASGDLSSGVWGSHLNLKPAVVKSSAPSNFEKLSTKLAMQATTSSTRKSLKKKVKKSTSFFDTLGESQNPMDTSVSSNNLTKSLSTPLAASHTSIGPDSSSDPPMKEEKQTLKEEKQKLKEEALEESSNSGGGELFPGLNISGTVAAAHQAPVKPAPKPFSLSRTVDSAWLARSVQHFLKKRCYFPVVLQMLKSGVVHPSQKKQHHRQQASRVFSHSQALPLPIFSSQAFPPPTCLSWVPRGQGWVGVPTCRSLNIRFWCGHNQLL